MDAPHARSAARAISGPMKSEPEIFSGKGLPMLRASHISGVPSTSDSSASP
jgi:hypothetical protein